MKIKATPIMGKDLQPGDLFSTRGAEYWDGIPNGPSIGERVYIRTNQPASSAPDGDEMIFKIEIDKS